MSTYQDISISQKSYREAYRLGQFYAIWYPGRTRAEILQVASTMRHSSVKVDVDSAIRGFVNGYFDKLKGETNMATATKTNGTSKLEQARKAAKEGKSKPGGDKPNTSEKDGMVNNLQISGWLKADVQLTQSKSGKEMIKAWLSIGKNVPGINVILMTENKEDVKIEEALNHEKGDHVVISGRLSVSEYDDKTQVTIFADEIV